MESRWIMNMPIDPRKEKALRLWIESRNDSLDDWLFLLRGFSDFGPVTIGDPKSARETAAYYKGKGWVGIYCDIPENKKSSYVSTDKVKITQGAKDGL